MSTKDRVLTILIKSLGAWVDGEKLAVDIGISRAAIWKAINSLRKDGYGIEGVNNRGYRIVADNDFLSLAMITPFLNDRSIQKKIHLYNSVDSTNLTAKKLAFEGAVNGTIVISDCQLLGKGRRARTFYSPAKTGIYMSLLLRPIGVLFADTQLITCGAAVAVCRAASSLCGIELNIRWVNDVMLDDKKICGILTEAVADLESGGIEYMVVGIGINFTTTAFPKEIKNIASPLIKNNDTSINRNQFIAELINQLMEVVTGNTENNFMDEYRERSELLGKEVDVISTDESFVAKVLKINNDGSLKIRKQNGAIDTLRFGEISVRKKDV